MSSSPTPDQSLPPVISPALRAVLLVPERLQMVAALQERGMTAKEYGDLVDQPAGRISRHFAILEQHDWLFVEGKTPKRIGGRRNIYRASKPPVIVDDELWRNLPSLVRSTWSQTLYSDICGLMAEALEAGTMDAQEDRHLSWSPLLLDSQGWSEVVELLGAVLHRVSEVIGPNAAARIAESNTTPIRATMSLGFFQSPDPSRFDERTEAWLGELDPIPDSDLEP